MKFTAEDLRPIVVDAIEIAAAAPLKEGGTYRTQIPWSLVKQLRRDLEAAGIDWKVAAR